MKYATPPLAALMATGKRIPRAMVFTLVTEAGADIQALAALSLGNPVGETFFWTAFDNHVQVGNSLFRADGPSVSGLKYTISRGLAVDSQKITFTAKPTDLVSGQPFLSQVAAGVLDGASFAQDLAFFDPVTFPPAPGAPAVAIQKVNLFDGYIGAVESVGRTHAVVEVRSELARLDAQAPRNLWQTACQHILFDTGCGLDRKIFQIAGVVSGASTRSHVAWSNSFAADYFTQGIVTFTSGVAEGISRMVHAHDSSGFSLIPPLPNAPSAADSFVIWPGCDHTRDGANGCAKFRNQRNFRGFRFVPPPLTAI